MIELSRRHFSQEIFDYEAEMALKERGVIFFDPVESSLTDMVEANRDRIRSFIDGRFRHFETEARPRAFAVDPANLILPESFNKPLWEQGEAVRDYWKKIGNISGVKLIISRPEEAMKIILQAGDRLLGQEARRLTVNTDSVFNTKGLSFCLALGGFDRGSFDLKLNLRDRPDPTTCVIPVFVPKNGLFF